MLVTNIALLAATPTLIYKCGTEQQLQIHHFILSNGDRILITQPFARAVGLYHREITRRGASRAPINTSASVTLGLGEIP